MGFVSLLRYNIDFGLLSTFALILNAWDKLVSQVMGLCMPWIMLVASWLGWKLTLHQHWGHVLVILELYFLTHSRMALIAGNWGAAFWTASWGSFIALVAAVVAGAVPISATIPSLLIPAAAVAGIFVYGTGNSLRAATFYKPQGQSWASAFGMSFRHSRRFLAVGSLVLFFALAFAAFINLEQPGLGVMVLIALFFTLGVYRIIMGANWGWTENNKNDSWWSRTRRSSEARIGSWMLLVIIVAFIFIGTGIFSNP